MSDEDITIDDLRRALDTQRAIDQQIIARLTTERNRARADLLRAETLLGELHCGAVDQAQSHVDVATKIEQYYAIVYSELPPLSEEKRARVQEIALGWLKKHREGRP